MPTTPALFQDLFRGLVDLVYPRTCAICSCRLPEHHAEPVCGHCWSAIACNPPPHCRRCGRHLETGPAGTQICADCAGRPPAFDRAFSPCLYEGALQKLIQAFKYRGRDYLAGCLARLLAGHIREHRDTFAVIDCVTGVPLHAARLREREYNQAQLLAAEVSRFLERPLVTGCLTRIRHTASQTGLAPEQRRANLRGSFRCGRPDLVAGRHFLLVDDVLTTCATASAAAQALKDAGAGIVFVLTLAR